MVFCLGDSLGNNKLCGHYQNFSKNLQRKQRECNVSHMDSDNVCFPCRLNLGTNNIKDKVEKCVNAIERRQNVTQNCESLKNISQSAIIPARSTCYIERTVVAFTQQLLPVCFTYYVKMVFSNICYVIFMIALKYLRDFQNIGPK